MLVLCVCMFNVGFAFSVAINVTAIFSIINKYKMGLSEQKSLQKYCTFNLLYRASV